MDELLPALSDLGAPWGSPALQVAPAAARSLTRREFSLQKGQVVPRAERDANLSCTMCRVGRAGGGNINSTAWLLCLQWALYGREQRDCRLWGGGMNFKPMQIGRPGLNWLIFRFVLLKRENELQGLVRSTGQGAEDVQTHGPQPPHPFCTS